MRTVKKPEVRKKEIMAGALTTFLNQGYDKTTIADIAKELGISQGLCYRYFASKEEIYDEVIDTYAVMIAEKNLKNRPAHQSIGTWIGNIPHMLLTMEVAQKEDPKLYALLHHPQNGKMHRELCMKTGEKLIPHVAKVLEEARAAGEIRVTDCYQTAAFGVYGEIGLLMTQGSQAGQAIQENWKRLLDIR